MASQKKKSVTLVKNGRKVTLTIPRDIVQYRAAGWREEAEAEKAAAPEADSPQDSDEPSGKAAGDNPRPAASRSGKGGSQK